jgi:hypothetical protein
MITVIFVTGAFVLLLMLLLAATIPIVRVVSIAHARAFDASFQRSIILKPLVHRKICRQLRAM